MWSRSFGLHIFELALILFADTSQRSDTVVFFNHQDSCFLVFSETLPSFFFWCKFRQVDQQRIFGLEFSMPKNVSILNFKSVVVLSFWVAWNCRRDGASDWACYDWFNHVIFRSLCCLPFSKQLFRNWRSIRLASFSYITTYCNLGDGYFSLNPWRMDQASKACRWLARDFGALLCSVEDKFFSCGRKPGRRM